MSRDQAIAQELARYIEAARAGDTHRAHIHLLAMDRLRYPYAGPTRKGA